MIYVTHDQVEAMTMASRIVVLRAGQIEQVGTPHELYTRPANLFVAGFIGSPKINMFDGMAKPAENGISVRLDGFPAFDIQGLERTVDQVTVCLRPEAFSLGGGPVSLEGKIELVEYLGSEILLHARLPNGAAVLLQTSGKEAFSKGQTLSLGFDPADAHVFDESGARVAYHHEAEA
jgi:ABC-type sugar transport system ATPase subunit